jgi:uncharacterized membrane protein
MPFCGKCGSSVADGVAFCPHCGAIIGAVEPPPPAGWVPPAAAPSANGLQENIAGLLCYAVGWITGIIFLIIDKRPFVRFHAAQSIVVFGGLNIIRVALLFGFFGSRGYGLFSIWSLLSGLISLVTLVAWIALMVLAYQGKRVEVPIAAGIAKSIAGSTAI